MTKRSFACGMVALVCATTVLLCAFCLPKNPALLPVGPSSSAILSQTQSPAMPSFDLGSRFLINRVFVVDDNTVLVLGWEDGFLCAAVCDLDTGVRTDILCLPPVNETELSWKAAASFRDGWYFTTGQRLLVTDADFAVVYEIHFADVGLVINDCALSPDGNHLVYTDQTGIWVSDLHFAHKKLLEAFVCLDSESDCRFARSPIWSKDGTQILYEWCSYEVLLGVHVADMNGVTHVVDGSQASFLTYTPSSIVCVNQGGRLDMTSVQTGACRTILLAPSLCGYDMIAFDQSQDGRAALLALVETKTQELRFAVVDLTSGDTVMQTDRGYGAMYIGQSALIGVRDGRTLDAIPLFLSEKA